MLFSSDVSEGTAMSFPSDRKWKTKKSSSLKITSHSFKVFEGNLPVPSKAQTYTSCQFQYRFWWGFFSVSVIIAYMFPVLIEHVFYQMRKDTGVCSKLIFTLKVSQKIANMVTLLLKGRPVVVLCCYDVKSGLFQWFKCQNTLLSRHGGRSGRSLQKWLSVIQRMKTARCVCCAEGSLIHSQRTLPAASRGAFCLFLGNNAAVRVWLVAFFSSCLMEERLWKKLNVDVAVAKTRKRSNTICPGVYIAARESDECPLTIDSMGQMFSLIQMLF